MYVIVEGIDGSGKTTLVQNIAATLRSTSTADLERPFQTVSEPSEWANPVVHTKIRELLASGQGKEALLGLFLADRLLLQEKMAKATSESLRLNGKGVDFFSDRSFVSALAYQALKFPVEMLKELHRNMPFPPTDLIYLDVSPERAVSRLEARGIPLEMYETVPILTDLKNRYEVALEAVRELYPDVRIHRIPVDDCTPAQVLARALECLRGN